ncbi:MAG: hypothetical protein HPM95_16345 [Alphaproteobacteria bacterium]|nr:hypothetical protein [Alphaproteobacteria bacterium]
MRALIHIYPSDTYTFFKRIERLRMDGQDSPPDVYKYEGSSPMSATASTCSIRVDYRL